MPESRSEGYDYVIVGAGSAGCVLANRLGADRGKRILVLEAGPMDRDLMIHIPAGVYRAWRDPRLNWNYATAPEPAAEGREIFTPRGRVVGGSSSINSMVYMRGHPLDYDGWAEAPGMGGWGYAHCLPYFKAGEAYAGGADAWRGGAGELGTCKGSYENPLYDAFIEAGRQAGQGYTDDPNGFQPEGVCRLDASKRHGRRCSAAVAHLRPALRRGNVELRTGAQVDRVHITGNRAGGVVVQGALIEAGEVILCGGAINSPQLLMLSGVGPADHLARHGIAPRLDLPGVGSNLQDHANVILQWESLRQFPIHRVDRPWNKALAGARWVFARDGVAASNIWEAGGCIRGNDRVAYANHAYHFGPVGFDYADGKIALSQAFAIHLDVSRPRARGTVRLASADPRAKPVLRFNYLADPGGEDMREMIEGVRRTQELVAQPAFAGLAGRSLDGPMRTDAEVAAWLRAHVETDFHPSCSCAMGAGPDAVVGPDFKVHGLEGLRVVDASAMPRITSANLNAPVQMMAARAADMIAGRPQLAPIRAAFAFQN